MTATFEVDEFYRLAFEAAPNAMLWVNHDGKILLVNQQAEASFGYGRKELLGQPVELLVPEGIRPKHAEHLVEFFNDPQMRSLGVGRDLQGCRKDGSAFPIEIGLTPLQIDGEATALASIIDISERKRAEEELKTLNVTLESRVVDRTVELEARTQELVSANEQLVRERRLLNTLVESMPDAIYFKDRQSRFIRVNPGVCAIFGVDDAAAILGKTDAEFFSSDEACEYYSDEQHIIDTGEPLIGKEEYECWQDGEMHWVLTTKMPLLDEYGEIVGTFGISRDITMQKQAEAALRQSEERFDLAAKGSSDGLWDWDVTTDTEWWSPRFYELLGYADGEIEATHEAFAALLHPEDRQRTLAALAAQLENADSPYDVVYRLRTKSGTYRWFSARGQAVWNEAGEPIRMAGSIRDITGRMEAEEALRQSEERFRGTFEQAAVGIAHVAPDGRFVRVNQKLCDILGYERAGLLNCTFQDITHPDDLSADLSNVERVLAGEIATYSMDKRYFRKDRSIVWGHLTVSLVRSESGAPKYFISVVEDVSDRKYAQEQLQRYTSELEVANRDLQDFAYIVSHDLREPLRAVTGFCDLLKHKYQGQLDDKGDEFMQHVVEGAARMNNLLDGLLAYSRIGTHGSSFERIDCNEVLDAALANLYFAIDESNANIERDKLPCIEGDKTQLVQLFQNLIANAIKYRSQLDPRVRIVAVRDGDNWRFSVQDNGIGMEPSQVERIYGIFQRLHTREEYPGMGVGLAICKRIVQRHGGRIWAESEPGKGSTFLFTISEPLDSVQ